MAGPSSRRPRAPESWLVDRVRGPVRRRVRAIRRGTPGAGISSAEALRRPRDADREACPLLRDATLDQGEPPARVLIEAYAEVKEALPRNGEPAGLTPPAGVKWAPVVDVRARPQVAEICDPAVPVECLGELALAERPGGVHRSRLGHGCRTCESNVAANCTSEPAVLVFAGPQFDVAPPLPIRGGQTVRPGGAPGMRSSCWPAAGHRSGSTPCRWTSAASRRRPARRWPPRRGAALPLAVLTRGS